MIRLLLLPTILQALLIIHVIKTGRDTSWIYILIFIPIAGGIAYIVVELIPAIFTRHRITNVTGTIDTIVNPGGKIERLEEQVSISPTFKNLTILGDAYFDAGRYSDAIKMYDDALKPPFDSDSKYLIKKSNAYLNSGKLEDAIKELNLSEKILNGNLPEEGLLIKSMIHEKSGQCDVAKEYLIKACNIKNDFFYRFEYGKLLSRIGEKNEAERVLLDIYNEYKRMPSSAKKYHRSLINEVSQEIKIIDSYFA